MSDVAQGSVAQGSVARGSAAQRSPAHRVARIGREVVQEVLLTVQNLPRRVDRSAIVSDLERAIAGLSDLEQSPVRAADHLDLLEKGRQQIQRAVDAIEGRGGGDATGAMAKRLRAVGKTLAQARDATIDAVVAAQGDAEEAMGRRLQIPDPKPFSVSIGVPRLHALDRELIKTRVDMAPDDLIYEGPEDQPEQDEPDPDNLAEGEIELDPLPDPEATGASADTSGIDPAKRLPLLVPDADATPTLMNAGLPGEIAQVERIVRACLEDIGAMSTLRRLYDHERFDFEAMERFESRMCAALDAAVAVTATFHSTAAPGARFSDVDLLDLTVRYGREGATADPHRTYARTFVLTSIAGSDTVRAAVLALKQSAPYTYRSQADALILAPNPAVGVAMKELCNDDDPRLAALALDVLAHRGEAEYALAAPLLEHVSEEVRRAAVRALGRVRATERKAARKVLIEIVETELDDDIYVEATEALTLLGCDDGMVAIRDRLIEVAEDDEYSMRADLVTRGMQLLAVAGKADDYLLLERVYTGESGQAMALGFHGHAALVERLIGSLDARGGLLLGPRAKVEAARSLSRITGAPLFRRKGGDIDPYDVITDREEWQSWWEQNRELYDKSVRYRFGKPYVVHQTAAELGRDHAPVALRRLCALELGVQLGGTPFPTHDYVVNQRDALGRARASTEAAFAAGELTEGAWPKLERAR